MSEKQFSKGAAHHIDVKFIMD